MKKIIMMLVTMSMILSFVACGNSKETGNSETVATDRCSRSAMSFMDAFFFISLQRYGKIKN